MKLNSRKGEAVTIAVAGVAVACIAIGLLFRPIMDKVLPMFSNNQKVISTKVVESKPVWIKNPDGTSTMVQTTSTVTSNSTEPVKLTFMQKVMNLGTIGIILITLGGIFPPFGLILTIVWRKVMNGAKLALDTAHMQIDEWTSKHEDLTSEAKIIVSSVDAGLATMDANIKAASSLSDSTTDPIVKANCIAVYKALVDMKQDFVAELSKGQDSTTKLLVAQLKND